MKTLPAMLLQVTRNPEHLSMSRDSNCTKQIDLAKVDSLGRTVELYVDFVFPF
jgi:hypothetical protein